MAPAVRNASFCIPEMSIRLPEAMRRTLGAWAREGYPHEICGMLIGRKSGDHVEVADVVRARNLNAERSRDRYELDPLDMLKTDEQARSRGLEIVGVWHTHPDHAARPSETDRAQAWQAWIYLILSVQENGVKELRAWQLDGAGFLEEALEP